MQSERNSDSKSRGWKKTKLTIRYLPTKRNSVFPIGGILPLSVSIVTACIQIESFDVKGSAFDLLKDLLDLSRRLPN